MNIKWILNYVCRKEKIALRETWGRNGNVNLIIYKRFRLLLQSPERQLEYMFLKRKAIQLRNNSYKTKYMTNTNTQFGWQLINYIELKMNVQHVVTEYVHTLCTVEGWFTLNYLEKCIYFEDLLARTNRFVMMVVYVQSVIWKVHLTTVGLIIVFSELFTCRSCLLWIIRDT